MKIARMEGLEGLSNEDELHDWRHDNVEGFDVYRNPDNEDKTRRVGWRISWPYKYMGVGDVVIIRDNFDEARNALNGYRKSSKKEFEVNTCYQHRRKDGRDVKLKWLEIERTK